jgi:uncharacterized protein YuzE
MTECLGVLGKNEGRMTLLYDADVDALYVRLTSDKIVESEEIKPNVVFDHDANGKLVAIEFLDARGQLPPAALLDIKAA